MSKLQLRNIVNPNIKQVEGAHFLRWDVCLSDLHPEDIPQDAQYVCGVDQTGSCIGAVPASRLCAVLRTLRETQMAPVLDELEDGVVAVDMQGIIFYVNPAYSKILNVPAGKILGKDMHIIENSAHLLKVLHTGQPIHCKRHMIQSVQRYVSCRMFPLTSQGRMMGAVSIFKDMTELNQLSFELERTAQVAAEYNRQIEAQDILRKNNVIGESRSFVNSVVKATAVAKTDATVLLRGKTGWVRRFLPGCSTATVRAGTSRLLR